MMQRMLLKEGLWSSRIITDNVYLLFLQDQSVAQIAGSEAKRTDNSHVCSYLCSQLPLISPVTLLLFPFVIYQYPSFYLFQFSLYKEKERMKLILIFGNNPSISDRTQIQGVKAQVQIITPGHLNKGWSILRAQHELQSSRNASKDSMYSTVKRKEIIFCSFCSPTPADKSCGQIMPNSKFTFFPCILHLPWVTWPHVST